MMSLDKRSVAGLSATLIFALLAIFTPTAALGVTQTPQWSVTAVSGPTNFAPAVNEVQAVTIAAGGGTFTLAFGGQTTSAIPYNGTAVEVQSDLNALSTIGGLGGSVVVTGGPGNPGAANPYIVKFGGGLAETNVEQLTVDAGSLLDAVGDTFSCTAAPEGAFTYQWLRSGQPISGATSSTYTTDAADAGEPIQCLVTEANEPGISGVSQPPRIVAPTPLTAIPMPPERIEVEGAVEVGETLRCEAGSWTGSPTFAYQWLKNGAPISGATSNMYVVQEGDITSNLQCEVLGVNAGGGIVQVSENKNAIPFINKPLQAIASTSPATTVSTQAQGGSTGLYTVTVTNTGGAPSNGGPITIEDMLPGGLTLGPAGASGVDQLFGSSLSCAGLTCTYSGTVVPDDTLTLTIPVEIGLDTATDITNTVTVSGGGAPDASVSTPTMISSTPAGFGIAPGSGISALSSTQAGAHADLTTILAFNTGDRLSEDGDYLLAGDPRSTVDDLPAGFAGDLADTPTCQIAAFSRGVTGLFVPQTCPLSTQVGTTTLTLNVGYQTDLVTVPVYNLTPNPGEVAKLGFVAVSFGIQGEISLRPGDYGVRTSFENISETIGQLDRVSLSIWGVPADPSHDAIRGLVCFGPGNCQLYLNSNSKPVEGTAGQPSSSPAIPYLTNPTECSGDPLQAKLSSTSWEQSAQTVIAESDVGITTGCNLLEFSPWIAASPDTSRADTPAGLTFDLKVPQEGLTSPEGLSTADIQDTTVTLPVGLVINPGQAAGLQACQFSEDGVGQEGPALCPNASRVGTDEIETPLLKRKLEGDVYVLQSNPPDVKLLVTASAPVYGIYIKLIGEVHLDPLTGQLTTTFSKTPELPFDDFKLSFSGGAQAALATPTACEIYKTNADFTPWTTPEESDALSASDFTIDSGPGGSACASPSPFSPSLIAGATTDQAGGFTDFSLLLQRADGQQRISSLQFETPKGLLGMISKVPLCQAPQAQEGACPAASQIGHTVVEAGPGPYPLVVPQPGQPPAPIYLTGGYEGAPYGLSIAVPVVAGPFNLGTIVVRSKIEVDPHTAQLTITTDPLPAIIDGIPTDLRTINAVIDKPGFMFNPTNCDSQSFGGTARSIEGVSAAISSRFQVGSCQSLPFKPDFKVTASGKTSRANGASLTAKIVYPAGSLGSNQASGQSNIAKVKVDLPKQLPSRLTTLQKACTAAVFEANPTKCPTASVVGHATAVTPVLPVPLKGPAYFVSHGGEAFPSLIIVLQGYNITIDLVGTTFISKAGITSSTFKSVPDVPVSSFELTFPEGRYSALAADGNLCKAKLAIPTAFVGQNGAEIHESTPIKVTSCPKANKRTSKRTSEKRRKRD